MGSLRSSKNLFLTGAEWLVDAQGCRPDRLANLAVVEHVCRRIIAELGLKVVGQPQWHQFPPPHGVTGLYLLSESHLACHTYPETGLATFNLYCCRPRTAWPWEDRLCEMLQAQLVNVRYCHRCAIESNGKILSSLPAAGGQPDG